MISSYHIGNHCKADGNHSFTKRSCNFKEKLNPISNFQGVTADWDKTTDDKKCLSGYI